MDDLVGVPHSKRKKLYIVWVGFPDEGDFWAQLIQAGSHRFNSVDHIILGPHVCLLDKQSGPFNLVEHCIFPHILFSSHYLLFLLF